VQKKFTFKKDITKKFMFFAIIPSLLLTLFLFYIIIDLKEDFVKDSHIKTLKNIDSSITSFYSELASTEEMIIKAKNKDKSIYQNILNFRKYIASIVLIDKNGKVKKIYSNQKIPFDHKFDYLKVFDLKTFLETKQSFLGDIYSLQETNVSYLPYLFESNGTIYILNIKLEHFNNYIKTLVGEDKSIKVCIVDKNGLCIVDSLHLETVKEDKTFYKTTTGKATLLGKEYELLKFSEKNQTQRVTYINQKDTGWKLIVKDEFDKVYDFIQNILLIIISFLILLFVLTIITAKKVAKSIVEPVESLILEIQDFANETEHLDTTNDIKSKYYIFNILIASFEKMKNDIIDREIELINLNEHLEEKTTQLETINQTLQIKLQSEK